MDADPQLGLLQAQTPVVGEGLHVLRHEEQAVGLGPRDGQGVLAERSLCQVPGRRAELETEEDGPHRRGEAAQEILEPRTPGEVVAEAEVTCTELSEPELVERGRAAFLGAHHALDPGSPTLENQLRVGASSDGVETERCSVGAQRQTGGVGHMELRDTGELLEPDPQQRVHVAFGCAVGGDTLCQ